MNANDTSANALTGVRITEQDLLLIIGDQTVTIAILRQRVTDLQTQVYESAMKTLATEQTARDEAVGLGR